MPDPTLAAALESGATVVTPNQRLARRLVALHDAAWQAQGAKAWPAARVLPWTASLTELWHEFVAAAPEHIAVPGLLTDAQAHYLWHTVVSASAMAASPLFDAPGAASLAADAWALMHAWGAGGESWRGWRSAEGSDGTVDQASFAAWAEAYHRELARAHVCDRATLPDVLARHAVDIERWRGRPFAFAGFLELTPQQQRLQEALRRAGATVIDVPTTVRAESAAIRVDGANARDELRRALHWARRRVLADPAATVGIAVTDLAQRRDEVAAMALEVLSPELQWPGRSLAARPFDVSLGAPLAQVPLVATALDLLALAHGGLAETDAAALVRSPYLPGSARWARRAGLARGWIEEGRRLLRWDDVRSALQAADPELARRFARLTAMPTHERRTLRQWVDAWRAFLAAAGWPGDATLASPEFQACGAWDDLCAAVATSDRLGTAQTSAQAFAYLRTSVHRQIFQPETGPAPILIMGVLEAAGLPLDALWVCGLDAELWPAAPAPNPLLPLRWQRERGVPRSSAPRELDYARVLTRALGQGAATVVMSHARMRDEYPSAASLLMLELVAGDLPDDDAARIAPSTDRSLSLQSVPDECAPPLPPDARTRGGAGLVAAQSDCPFRATATYRLRADPWPVAPEGLNAAERGNLVHATLAQFWRGARTHDALRACTPQELAARVEDAAAGALGTLPAARRALLAPVVVAGETTRLRELALRWLGDCEWHRPAFAVEAIETDMTIELAGLVLSLRLDRVDHLATGGALIIDYKTGPVPVPKNWVRERPQATQLGLYALAWPDHAPSLPVRGVAYAQLAADRVRTVGVSGDGEAWPALADVAGATGLPGWSDLSAWWRTHLEGLAEEFRRGHAAVAPRDDFAPCRQCGRQALCRIGAARDDGEDDA